MNVLGISALDKESTVTIIKDGKLVAAVSEERLTRKKQQSGFPHKSIIDALELAKLDLNQIDVVAYPFLGGFKETMLMWKCFFINLFENLFLAGSVKEKIIHLANYFRITILNSIGHIKYDYILRSELKKLGLLNKLKYYHHQLSHCMAAYYTSGFEQSLCVSIDSYGSGLSGAVYSCNKGIFKKIVEIPYPHSMGAFYYRVTKALGFTPDRHEGKVLGLAAFGDPQKVASILRKYFTLKNGVFRFGSSTNYYRDLEIARNFSREDVAAGYQHILEEVTTYVINEAVKNTGLSKIALAGGTFANVKLNQRIAEIDGVEKVFIHPAMGDSGSGTGAAYFAAQAKDNIKTIFIDDVYLGKSFTRQEVESSLNRYRDKVNYHRPEDVEGYVAKQLSKGKVIAHFSGRMEYGPRALGSRSILYQTTEKSVNDWLNKRLKRTEFMPFAPATIKEAARECYKNFDTGENAANFMTITFDCTDKMIKDSPAAVHVDNTARPQILTEEKNPRFYKIVKKYHQLTNIPSIINTSFNMHEEPIVCSPNDAIRAYLDSKLDYLILDDYVVTLKEE